MNLKDTVVRNMKGGDKPRKIADGRGLYLLVTPKGARYWRWKYRFGAKEKVMAFGVYPEVSLALARERHREARLLHLSGADPMVARKAETENRAGFVTFRQAACVFHGHPATDSMNIRPPIPR
ncbi:Arm DNA-binding domain-containing protein [Pseudomonas sp. DSP3-2-2]|uniref:Arm DNA-binding domain-containing protein n=1 Tax=unclassified Pseudomonas TaxID=196821 RepID=UPI003CF8B962